MLTLVFNYEQGQKATFFRSLNQIVASKNFGQNFFALIITLQISANRKLSDFVNYESGVEKNDISD